MISHLKSILKKNQYSVTAFQNLLPWQQNNEVFFSFSSILGFIQSLQLGCWSHFLIFCTSSIVLRNNVQINGNQILPSGQNHQTVWRSAFLLIRHSKYKTPTRLLVYATFVSIIDSICSITNF